MSLVLADTGAEAIVSRYFNGLVPAGGTDLALQLFVNDVTPDDGPVTYAEAAGAGYVAVPLVAGSFTISAVGGIARATYARQTFIFDGPLTTNLTIYGYYVVDSDGAVIWAERAATPFTPEQDGDRYLVDPVFELSHGTPIAT